MMSGSTFPTNHGGDRDTMIEMRWLKRSTGERVIDHYGLFQNGVETVLQYRQIMNQTRWGDWQDVPTVESPSTDASKYNINDKE